MRSKKRFIILLCFQMFCLFGLMLCAIYTFWYNAIQIFEVGIQHKDFYPLIIFVVSLVIGAILSCYWYNKEKIFRENWLNLYFSSTIIANIVFVLYMGRYISSSDDLQLYLIGCAINVMWHNVSVSFLITIINKIVRRYMHS